MDNAGYETLPAKSTADASALLEQLKLEIDVLIVNPSLDGASEFANTLRRLQGHLKVIAVIDPRDEPPSLFPGADASEFRPLNPDKESRLQWLQTIQHVLELQRHAARY
jgi:hypothetical protein